MRVSIQWLSANKLQFEFQDKSIEEHSWLKHSENEEKDIFRDKETYIW